MKAIFLLPTNLFKFLNSVVAEMKLVKWITLNQTVKKTTLIIASVLLLGVLLALLDQGFIKLLSWILNK